MLSPRDSSANTFQPDDVQLLQPRLHCRLTSLYTMTYIRTPCSAFFLSNRSSRHSGKNAAGRRSWKRDEISFDGQT